MAHPLDYFDRIYIINLPYRTDRKAEMAEQLRKIGLSFDSANVVLFPAVRPEQAMGFPTIGTRGCFLSHLGVLQDAARAGLSRVLILEDDLNFSADFLQRMPEVINALQSKSWSVFYGGYRLMSSVQLGDGVLQEVGADISIETAHFIAMAGDAIPQAAAYLEAMLARPAGDPNGGPMHVDGAYNWFRRQYKGAGTVIALSELGFQRASRTDIHDLNWYDKWPLVRQLAGVARKWI